MLNSIIVGGDPEGVTYLRQVCAEFEDICIYKTLAPSARRYEVVATLNAYAPDLVFLGVTEGEEESAAAMCLEELLQRHWQTAIVPFSGRPADPDFADTTLLRMGTVLRAPFNADHMEASVREALRRSKPRGTSSQVVAMMPAKPGAGTTTLALNLAGVAAKEFGKRTLLIEADYQAGPLSYLLNLQTLPGGEESNWSAHQLVDREWNRMVRRSHGIDVLPCGSGVQGQRNSRWDFCRLLRFASERYEVILLDLPPVLDETTESILQEADKVLLVCTPENPSLGMVRRRLFEMERSGFRHAHLEVVVNRYAPGDPNLEAMTATARHPLFAMLPEDSAAVRTATRNYALIGEHTKLGRSLLPFAGQLLGYGKDAAGGAFAFLNGSFLRKVFGRPAGAEGAGGYDRLMTKYMEAKGARYNPDRGRQLDRW